MGYLSPSGSAALNSVKTVRSRYSRRRAEPRLRSPRYVAFSPASHPKYCCHKARGLARVTIDGKDHCLGPYGSTESKDRYRRLVGEWLDRQQLGAMQDEIDVRVCELAVAYLRHYVGYYRKGGVITREYGAIANALKHVRKDFDLERVDLSGPRPSMPSASRW